MKKNKLIGSVSILTLVTTIVLAKNLDKMTKDVCAALSPMQALICCGSACTTDNTGGTQQEIDDCINDCKDYLKNG